MPTRRVIGLDLSLTSTGIARGDQTLRSRTKPDDGTIVERVALHLEQIRTSCWLGEDDFPVVAVVESPAFSAASTSSRESGYLWWRVVEFVTGEPFGMEYVTATPMQVKKYATGSGKAEKEQMVRATLREFPAFDGNNDEADALWLAAMGAHWLGEPCVSVEQAFRTLPAAWPSRP